MKKRVEDKKAILLVAFGTSIPEAAKALDRIEARTREKYPGIDVRWAYTSKTIRSRIGARGKSVDSPATALSRLMDEGFSHVAVLSLHVVPGQEFHSFFMDTRRFAGMSEGFEKVHIARPLLGDYEDMSRAADILSNKYASLQKPGEGVIFVGHGNRRHPSDAIYVAMDSLLRDRGANLFVGTVQGHPAPDELLPKLRAANIRKTVLVPLMTVAGDHARKDMAGDDPGSWKSVLERQGIQCEAVFTGLAECGEITEIWMDHLDEVFSRL
ncbi:MAG: sirohydrochlorin cobaltochelatase [Syntrophobacter sp.]